MGPAGARESRGLERLGGGRGRIVQRDRGAGAGERRARGRIAQRRERPREFRRVEPLRREGHAQRRGRHGALGLPAHGAQRDQQRRHLRGDQLVHERVPGRADHGVESREVAPQRLQRHPEDPIGEPRRARGDQRLREHDAPAGVQQRLRCRPHARRGCHALVGPGHEQRERALVPVLDADRGTRRRATERLTGRPHDEPDAAGRVAGQIGERDDGGHGRAAGPVARVGSGRRHPHDPSPGERRRRGQGPVDDHRLRGVPARDRVDPAAGRRLHVGVVLRQELAQHARRGGERQGGRGQQQHRLDVLGQPLGRAQRRVADPAPSATVETRSMCRGRRRGGRAGGPLGSPISSRRRRSWAGAAKLRSTCSRAAADRSR